MELWVRLQDKERLLKIKDIFLNYDGYHCNKFHLITYDDKKYEINLGTYKTKERALEIIDEIQNFMLCNKEYKYTTIASINELGGCYIYQMPEE